MSASSAHPMATGHIPSYVTAADGSDYLFTFMIYFTIALILLIGVAYFTLHALPERMAHGNNHPQFQLVGILALLALFTHNNVFWIGAILVAGFQIPDVAAPLRDIAGAIRDRSKPSDPSPDITPEPTPAPSQAPQTVVAAEEH